MAETISYRFLVRGGTEAAVEALNEIPLKRELVIETDTLKMKLGDGVTRYNDLPYLSAGGGGSGILTVSAPPTDDLGEDGDYAIWPDVATPTLYGPKADGAWPAGVPLKGADGAPGAPGAPGIPGPSSQCFPTASFNGGAGTIEAGAAQSLYVPFGFTITGAALIADQVGTVQIDIRKTPLANYPPTSLDSVCGGVPPTLSNNNKIVISDLSLWDVDVAAGDTLQFICTACVGIRFATLTLTGTRN